MKTYTKALLMLALFLFGTAGLVSAQEDPVNVTFRVNTSTVADTLSADGVLQIRGAVNGEEFTDEGYFGQNINWSTTSVQAENVLGDYWEFNLQMAPGDELVYKFWAGTTPEDGLGFNDGWEFNFDGDGDNYTFAVPEDATEDIVTDLQYFAGTSDGRQAPFDPAEEGLTAVHFRVNVGARVATGQYDPEDEDMIVGLRGAYDEEQRFVTYKYVIEDADGNVQWEDGADKELFVPQADTTVAWSYYNDEVPPSGEIVTANVEFQANVSLLESLGFFNRGIGDEVAVPGAFNSWDSGTPMNYNEAEDVWTESFELSREVGSDIPFKYYIIWDESRFDEDSENFIPNLVADNGWEEPGTFGGGDRLFTFGSEEQQIAEGDFGGDIGFFNSLPEQALITETGAGAASYPVTFEVDMTDALEADVPFDPLESGVYLVLETPILALTQGIPTGVEALEDPDTRELLTFEPTGDDNMYTLTFDLQLPTENHFGFTIAYEDEDGQFITNGGGFDAGRRYYRYVEPETVLDDFTIWPAGGFTFDLIEWKAEDLDFPEPPAYGLGEPVTNRPVLFDEQGNPLDGFATTFAFERENQPENGNHFYSGTIYIESDATNIDDPRNADMPSQIELSQNYPNPFNPTTNINFTLPEMADVRLDVFNVLGQRVATLVDGNMNAGTHTVQFDASDLSSGVYLYRLTSGSFTSHRSMMLVK